MKYTGKHYVGEVVNHRGHECKVTAVWEDEGRNGISIEPVGDYGFSIDIYDGQLVPGSDIVRITYDKLWEIMHTYNRWYPKNENEMKLCGVIVYKASNWDTEYPLEARSYEVWNNNRCFQPNKISNSLFGSALDGSDNGVRLDWYNWDVEYCYMI